MSNTADEPKSQKAHILRLTCLNIQWCEPIPWLILARHWREANLAKLNRPDNFQADRHRNLHKKPCGTVGIREASNV